MHIHSSNCFNKKNLSIFHAILFIQHNLLAKQMVSTQFVFQNALSLFVANELLFITVKFSSAIFRSTQKCYGCPSKSVDWNWKAIQNAAIRNVDQHWSQASHLHMYYSLSFTNKFSSATVCWPGSRSILLM